MNKIFQTKKSCKEQDNKMKYFTLKEYNLPNQNSLVYEMFILK